MKNDEEECKLKKNVTEEIKKIKKRKKKKKRKEEKEERRRQPKNYN